MDLFQSFWTWVYVLGIGSFVVIAILVVPLGFRDIVQLLKELARDKTGPDNT